MSRHLDINVNDAKRLLYTFYKSHKDSVEATFLISGTLEGVNGLKVKVTKELKDREKFDQIQSIQVYSLSPQNINVDEIVSTVNTQLQGFAVDESKLAKWGLIKGPELLKVESQQQQSKASSSSTVKKPDTKATTSTTSVKKKEFPDMGLRSAQILNKNRKKEDEKSKTRTTTQPTFGSSSKQAKPERSKTEPAKKVQTEDLELNDDKYTKKQIAVRAEKDKKQRELESMFDDDDDDDVIMQELSEVEDKGSEAKASKDNEDLEGIFDSSFSQTQSQPNKKEAQKEEKGEEEKEEGQKGEDSQLSSENKEEAAVSSYYDEDGYLVTKVAEKSKEKSKPKPKARATPSPASAPAAKKTKTTKSGGAKQQSSLMNFFGKK